MTKSGDAYEGIFSYSTPDSTETNLTLSMTRRIHSASEAQSNGVTDHDSHFIGSGPDFAMTFNVRDVADVNILEPSIPDALKSQNGKHLHSIQRPFHDALVGLAEVLIVRVYELVHELRQSTLV